MKTRNIRLNVATALAALAMAVSSTASLATDAPRSAPTRLLPSEIPWPAQAVSQQAGSSMQSGVQSLIVHGDAGKAELYSIMFKVAPNAAIPAHSHPDDRSCFVTNGLWYFGYGDRYDEAALKALPPGSHYTEPANLNHFAGTKGEGAIVECTSMGPAGTVFADHANDPRSVR
jgi:quercetin dioxygenase-like cupin family protein